MGARLRAAEEEAAQLHLEREESLRSLQQRAGADSELLVRGLVLAEELPHVLWLRGFASPFRQEHKSNLEQGQQRAGLTVSCL